MRLKGLFCKIFRPLLNLWSTLLNTIMLSFVLNLVLSAFAYAQLSPPVYTGPIPNDDYKFGRVMARAVVLDPDTGEPILVRFNEDGTEAGVVDAGGESVTEIGIFAAEDYRFFEKRLEAYKVQYEETLAKGAELLSRTEYESRDFKASDNETEIVKPTLPQGINSVLVRAQVRRIPKAESQQSEPDASLVLLRFPFDLTQDIDIEDASVSILVNTDGQIIEQSDKRMGYRNGFFGDPNEAQDARRYQVDNEDEVFGPVKSAKVYVDEFAYRGGVDTSDDEGKYSFRFYMPLCPLGGFTFTTDVTTDLFYKNFLPIGSPTVPYYVRTPGYSFCDAFLVPAILAPEIIAIRATSATFNRQSNLIVDVMFLTGRMEIKNVDGEPVPIGDTTYTEFEEEAEDTLQREYDFNRDDQADYVVQGKIEPRTDPDTGEEFSVFVQGEDEEFDKQGIFFDGSQEDEFDFPDLVRVLDQKLRSDEAVGVLKSISAADMRNTDILVFRDSTGQLVMERRGLKEEESEDRAAIQYDPDENEVGFTVMLRGFYDTALNIGGIGSLALRASYEDWATANQLTEPFRTRESDQLRPGEFVKVVAINRATGYMATAKVKLRSANELEGSTLGSTSDLTVAVPKMTLQPPNLKIWAEREYSVEKGITKDEERQYLIGSEGASLTSDTLIRVYTEWLDTEGYPLPRELGLDDGEEYGLTGRLAKVAGQNTLTGVNAGSDLAEFAIKPGRETQVIRVASNLSQAEHFYIHVIGKGKDQECVNQSSCPSFNQNGEGLYAGRPALLTPFKVPLFDENTTWLEYRSYRDVLDEFNEEDTVIEERPEQPLPSYVWQYRPEYQFSQYKLEVEEINRQIDTEDPDNPEVIDIFDLDNPVISSSDDLVNILYSLVSSQFERLDPIDGEQELVLALGEEEQIVTIGADQTITFENIEGLGFLDPEDFLTIRLYTNNDAGNILWEYAFDYIALETNLLDPDAWIGECLIISADEPTLDLYTILAGYSNREEPEPEHMQWFVEGDGNLSSSFETVDEFGVTNNTLTMPRTADAEVEVFAYLSGANETKAQFGYVCVEPGEPDQLEVTREGEAYIDGNGKIDFEVTVKDKWGNLAKDNTVVEFVTNDSILLSNQTGLTENGVARVTVLGDQFPVSNALLEVRVGDSLLKNENITINPISTQLSLPNNIEADQEVAVNVSVSPPLAGVNIVLSSNVGQLQDNVVTTDASGNASTQLKALQTPLEGSVFASINYNLADKADVLITSPLVNASMPVPVLIGDKADDGQMAVVDDFGLNFNASYKTNTQIMVKGDPGEVINLSLGSMKMPVEQALLYYPMNYILGDTVYDEANRRHANAVNVRTSEDSPMFNGASYQFIETPSLAEIDHYIELPDATAVQLATDWRIDVSAKLSEQTIEGTLFDLGNGIKLSVLNQQLHATLKIADQDIKLSTPIASLEQWYNVSLINNDQQVSLLIDGQIVASENINGATVYSDQGLRIGQDFNGLLSDFRITQLGTASKKLVTFADDSISTSVTIGDEGVTPVVIQSTGQMNSNAVYQQVPVMVGDEEYMLNVISLRTHEHLVIEYTYKDKSYQDALVETLTAQVTLPPSGFSLIESAYAQTGLQTLNYGYTPESFEQHYQRFELPLWISVFGDAQFYRDVARNAEQFLEDEVKGIAEQISEGWDEIGEAIATGEFNTVDGAILVLRGSLAIPLVRRYLQRSVGPLIKFLKRFGDKPIAKHVAATILRVLKPAAKGNFDPLIASMYGLILIADITELLLDPEAAELVDTINEVIDGVQSADDLAGIFSFAQLAIQNLAPNCTVDLNVVNFVEASQHNSLIPDVSELFFADAHAAGALRIAKRINVRKMFKSLNNSRKKLDIEPEGGVSASSKKFNLAKFIRTLGESLTVLDQVSVGSSIDEFYKEVLENLLDERFLLATMVITHREGPAAIKAFLSGDMPLRMTLSELLFAIATIETAAQEEKLDLPNYKVDEVTPNSEGLPGDRAVKWKIRDKYKSVFIAVRGKNNKKKEKPTPYIAINKMNGEAFQLTQIAAEIAANKTIIGVESDVLLQFKQTSVTGQAKNFGKPLKRRVDIVTGSLSNAQWIEVKSLAYNRQRVGNRQLKGIAAGLATLDLKSLSAPFNKKAFSKAVVNDSGQAEAVKVKSSQFITKELFVDRVFAGADLGQVPQRIEWRFHDFTKRNMWTYDGKQGAPRSLVLAEDKASNKFLQCGVNQSTTGTCASVYKPGDDPLQKMRQKLGNSIRASSGAKVIDIVFRTFGGADAFPGEKEEAAEYLEEFPNIANRFVKSASARDWIIQNNLIPNGCDTP